ncbi:MAG: acyl-CoA dehydrogenase family protein [Chloroflexi bacterium]|nr:acyl-CoA dehydrogenase family protein [Chloroflexota bacterium]
MDFEFRDTPKLAEFRKEVRAWLDLHIPMDFEIPDNPHDILPGSTKYEFILKARRALGAKGWLASTWPKEYGGGGLSFEEAAVVESEVVKRPWSRFGVGDFFPSTITTFGAQLLNLGTEEQKKRWLPSILRGEIIRWQAYSEPDAGSDIAAIKTTALRDGDDYIVNGTKVFLGTQYDNADYFSLIAITDPKAPRRRNVGLFFVPTNLQGISKAWLPLMRNCHSSGWQIFFDNVRVPVEYLIGGHENATNAWRSMRETAVHGANRPIVIPIRDRGQEFVLDYVSKTKRDGQLLSQDPDVRDALVETEIQLEVRRIFALRQDWMTIADKRLEGYEGPQSAVYGKVAEEEQANAYFDILGPAVLMKDPEWALYEGNMEYQHFVPVAMASAGMTQEVSKMLLARSACKVGD